MKRKQILPTWIRFFAWINFFFGILTPILLLLLLLGGKVSMMIFGLKFDGSTLQPLAIAISLIFALGGTAAYGILWGKNWAINLGTIYCFVGIATCIAALFIRLQSGEIYIAFEPFLLIPGIVTLRRNKSRWESFNSKQEDEKTSSEQDTNPVAAGSE